MHKILLFSKLTLFVFFFSKGLAAFYSDRLLQQDDGLKGLKVNNHDYCSFTGMKICYSSDQERNDKIILPINSLKDPLNGSLDLSKCGKSDQFLSISTGLRSVPSKSDEKIEIYITPLFLAEDQLHNAAKHLQPIMEKWRNSRGDIGIFMALSSWKLDWYDYMIMEKKYNELNLNSQHSMYRNLVPACNNWPTWVIKEMAACIKKRHQTTDRESLDKIRQVLKNFSIIR